MAMAGRTGHSMKKNAYRFFTPKVGPVEPTGLAQDEFEESEIWGGPVELQTSDPVRPIPRARPSRKKTDQSSPQTGPCSLPVNIPDWSKILGDEYRGNSYEFWDEESEIGSVIPPHEFLSKNRVGSSFSVHEGVGRTLKGRDLSRVRDAVWEKTGFQD